MKTLFIQEQDSLSESALRQAAKMVREGGLVAFPTETVYGLGGSIFSESAIQRIYKVKGRPSDNPLIVHVAEKHQIVGLTSELSPLAEYLLEEFTPGPLTLVLPRSSDVPIAPSLPSIAVRIPSHPVAQQFLRYCDVPVAAPSANKSGRPSPTRAEHVLQDLDGEIEAIIDGGASPVGIESTVVSLMQPQPIVLRPGSITVAELSLATGIAFESAHQQPSHSEFSPLAPGMKYRHYAPLAQVQLCAGEADALQAWQEKQHSAVILSVEGLEQHPARRLLSEFTLYSEFRRADEQGMTAIFIVMNEALLRREGLLNRIYKAASADNDVLP